MKLSQLFEDFITSHMSIFGETQCKINSEFTCFKQGVIHKKIKFTR